MSTPDDAPEVADFAAAADWIRGLVESLPADGWEGPGLGAWNLRALVGHASRSFVTVLTYPRVDTTELALPSAVSYLLAISRVDPASVVGRGVQAGLDLGDDPAGRFAELAGEAVALVRSEDLDQPVVTIGGAMRLRDYLPTRTFELLVHGLDIARAVGLETVPPADAVAGIVPLAVQAALAGGHGPALLLALTGRESRLGFSVV